MARGVLVDRSVFARLKADSEEKVQKLLVAEVHRQLDRAVKESEPSGVETWVDGAKDRAIEQIKSTGIFHAEFHYMAEAVQAALAMLEEQSPKLTGEYSRSHHVYIDGVRADSLEEVETAKRVVITSILPQSRRIEVGHEVRGKHVPWSRQAPDGVYGPVAKALKRRFGNLFKIDDTWVSATSDELTGSNKSEGRYPALYLERR